MLRLEGVSKSYGKIAALRDVSLRLPAGTLAAVAGEDGAGKTTLLKCVIGLAKTNSGLIFFEGAPVSDGFVGLRRAAGFMPEKFSLYPDLTVSETLDFAADIHGLTLSVRRERKEKLLRRMALAGFEKRRAGALSGGMRQKLALMAAMIHEPRLLVLDEPTEGLDPLSRIEILRMLTELKAEGRTILFSTTNIEEAEAADAFFYLVNGRLRLSGSVLDLKRAFGLSLENICALEEGRERDPSRG